MKHVMIYPIAGNRITSRAEVWIETSAPRDLKLKVKITSRAEVWIETP